jgi:hypothetical protein
MTGEELEVSDNFCCLDTDREDVFLVVWSFMDRDMAGFVKSQIHVDGSMIHTV